jgi:hypothetical protein
LNAIYHFEIPESLFEIDKGRKNMDRHGLDESIFANNNIGISLFLIEKENNKKWCIVFVYRD